VKRESRNPTVTVVQRGKPRVDSSPGAPSSAATKRTVPAPGPRAGAPPAPATATTRVAPSVASTRSPRQRRQDRDVRLAARAAPHAAAILRVLDEVTAANGGVWPHHVHVIIADAVSLPRSVVHAFLGTVRASARRSH
jgi:hypothetical protein